MGGVGRGSGTLTIQKLGRRAPGSGSLNRPPQHLKKNLPTNKIGKQIVAREPKAVTAPFQLRPAHQVGLKALLPHHRERRQGSPRVAPPPARLYDEPEALGAPPRHRAVRRRRKYTSRRGTPRHGTPDPDPPPGIERSSVALVDAGEARPGCPLRLFLLGRHGWKEYKKTCTDAVFGWVLWNVARDGGALPGRCCGWWWWRCFDGRLAGLEHFSYIKFGLSLPFRFQRCTQNNCLKPSAPPA